MLSKYWSPDATYSLNEGTLVLRGRDSLATLLRGVQLTTSMEPEVLELTSTTDRCVDTRRASHMLHDMPL